jgi:hypothetical protein
VVGIHEDVRETPHRFAIGSILGISKEIFDGPAVGNIAEFQVEA